MLWAALDRSINGAFEAPPCVWALVGGLCIRLLLVFCHMPVARQVVDFYGPHLKVERAEHHIRDLETIFRRYVSDNVKRLRPERKHRLLKQGQIARPATFPKHTPTVLGDVLHNLRVALDHAYCILVEANGKKVGDYTRFHFGKDRKSLEGTFNGHKKEGLAPSDAVIAAILDEIQPYERGKLGLYGLHRLDITDKHHILIPTETRMAIQRLDIVDKAGVKTGGGIQGIALVMPNQSQGAGGEFVSFGGGMSGVLHGDPKDAFQICFEPGQPFEGQSILDTVNDLRMKVIDTLKILERNA